MIDQMKKFIKEWGLIIFISILALIVIVLPVVRDFMLVFLGRNLIPKDIIVKLNDENIKTISITIFIIIVIVFFLSLIVTSVLPLSIKTKLMIEIEKLTKRGVAGISITENHGITKISESFEEGKRSLELIKNRINGELENTANLISAKIDENLYSYSLLKKDMLNSQMIFIYGNFIYLKKTQSNEFLISALANKYWVSDSFRYLIIITQRNKETVRNIFEFLIKIKSGIKDYTYNSADFNNFIIGFQNHDFVLPSPVQLVAFIFNNKDYSIKKGLNIEDIEKINFTGHQSLPVLKNFETTSELIKVTAAIDQTLIFSNDLITHNTDIEKQIIGFKIPINNSADKDYEVLKEFDRLKEKVTYVSLKDIINVCFSCPDMERCCDAFIKSIQISPFACENKTT
jgi:hypothetical protein